ncbi:MAG: 16S rRNA (adenine(1518)-N(6)/adenine(1519)-N(6))-dimethyltransferase RsmA [Flavobacteriales bacterium]|jgi:16S rRNA (adenine1518-N6/adenine1519-N6)-dimethyltransferase|tara:strand:- start:403 stop:1170 length:768 start_codon:yes stop_codon:yes gene_type:complete
MKVVRAKKYLGQHFLNDINIAKRTTDLLKKRENQNILEIGPGMGMLTQYLIEKKTNLKLIEIDLESIVFLENNFSNIENKIIEGDFLKININNIFKSDISIIGNFPYNISSQILFKVYENKDIIFELVGMFQKEVAERIISNSGRKRGILSVFVQAFYNVEYCFTIEAESFSPPPKIKSAVIKLSRNSREKLDCNPVLFKNIVKSAYNQRRKTLRNALKSFNLKIDDKITNLLTLRAEKLSVDEFITITQNVERQ